jgi:superfamily II DNA helicase RecQ
MSASAVPGAPLPSRAQVMGARKAVFGYESFRPLQEEIVRAILHGRDVFVTISKP